jgi:hypothetical protein
MREAGQRCTSYADYPPGPHQSLLSVAKKKEAEIGTCLQHQKFEFLYYFYYSQYLVICPLALKHSYNLFVYHIY